MEALRLVLILASYSFLQVSCRFFPDDNCEQFGVIGGHNVFIQNAPYIAAIYENGNFVCTGSIIHESFILTAASCASSAKKHVLVGSARLSKGKKYYGVVNEICRRDFKKETNANDLCVFKLDSKLKFGEKVRPVVLPQPNTHVGDGALVNVTGWGNVEVDGIKFPDRLQQTQVPIISKHCCKQEYSFTSSYKICAGTSSQGACEGDLGAPLTIDNVQIGVYSGSPAGCGHGPGIYTKVALYVDWIHSALKFRSPRSL